MEIWRYSLQRTSNLKLVTQFNDRLFIVIFTGPAPPGSDLTLYKYYKDHGYVAKDKSGWVYLPDEKQWYQRRSGIYFILDSTSNEYVPADGRILPTGTLNREHNHSRAWIEIDSRIVNKHLDR